MSSNRLFAVVLDDDSSNKGATYERLKKKFDRVYKHKDTLILVACPPDVLTREIAEVSGIRGAGREPRETGVVFKLNKGYSGFTNKALWEWLSDVVEDE